MQTIIKKIADKHLYRVNSDLLEDYSTNPIPPNDTSYVGFFFEKDVTQFPPKLREKYEAMKAEIDLKEAEYREKYGDDWRNIAVFDAYRGIKEDTELGESLSEDHFSEKELTNMYSKFDKENNHDGLEAIEDYISAEADGNKAAAAKAAGKLKKLMKEDVSEAIKGWKNAHSDIAKARSEQGKNVVLHRLKNDGTESGMATARTSFSSEEEAIKQHENMVKLNPGKKIGHNLYVNGKLIKALEESVSDSTVKMSMPLFIRLMEWAFEECKDDVQIHKLAENLSEISSVADMDDYKKIVKEELDEDQKIDKEDPIYKEYASLMKQSIGDLRSIIKQSQRIVDVSEYRTKDHAATAIIRNRHGNKKVDRVFGFSESVELDEALQGNWSVEKIQKLKPAQIKTLLANAEKANDKAVVGMIQLATAPKPKTSAIKMQPAKPKVDLDKVWYKIQDVVGQIVPDGDPIDYLAPWLERQGIKGFDIGEILDKASKKHGFKDIYAYYDDVKKQYLDMKSEAYGDKKYGLGKKSPEEVAQKKERKEKHAAEAARLRKERDDAEEAGDHDKADKLSDRLKLHHAMAE